MPTWWRRIVAIATLGGGFTGVVVTLATLFSSQQKPLAGVVLCVLVTLLYAYGVALGLAVAEGRNPTRRLSIYYGLQIPIFSSPQFAYHFISGFHVSIIVSGGQWGATFRLGSEWLLSFSQMLPWTVGINLFAIGILIMLITTGSRSNAKQPEHLLSSPSPDS